MEKVTTATKKGIIDYLEDKFRTTCIGEFYSDYYVGITNDINRRLFEEHKVDHYSCHWFHETSSREIADEIEGHFIAKGMKGHQGGGNKESVWIYIYRITPKTLEAPHFLEVEDLQEGKESPTVEIYTGKAEIHRFWKIRVVGKRQYAGFFHYSLKREALELANKLANEYEATVTVSDVTNKL